MAAGGRCGVVREYSDCAKSFVEMETRNEKGCNVMHIHVIINYITRIRSLIHLAKNSLTFRTLLLNFS